jgi:hypothetical protein
VKNPWARLSTYYLEKVKVNGLATVLQVGGRFDPGLTPV